MVSQTCLNTAVPSDALTLSTQSIVDTNDCLHCLDQTFVLLRSSVILTIVMIPVLK